METKIINDGRKTYENVVCEECGRYAISMPYVQGRVLCRTCRPGALIHSCVKAQVRDSVTKQILEPPRMVYIGAHRL